MCSVILMCLDLRDGLRTSTCVKYMYRVPVYMYVHVHYIRTCTLYSSMCVCCYCCNILFFSMSKDLLLTFGGGPRGCAGRHLSTIILKVYMYIYMYVW